MFTAKFSKELTRKLAKIQKKNKPMFDAVISKIKEIKENPEHYKRLRYNMKDYRRVHILKSFVLVFKIDHINNKITFEDFDHHDKIYKR